MSPLRASKGGLSTSVRRLSAPKSRLSVKISRRRAPKSRLRTKINGLSASTTSLRAKKTRLRTETMWHRSNPTWLRGRTTTLRMKMEEFFGVQFWHRLRSAPVCGIVTGGGRSFLAQPTSYWLISLRDKNAARSWAVHPLKKRGTSLLHPSTWQSTACSNS